MSTPEEGWNQDGPEDFDQGESAEGVDARVLSPGRVFGASGRRRRLDGAARAAVSRAAAELNGMRVVRGGGRPRKVEHSPGPRGGGCGCAECRARFPSRQKRYGKAAQSRAPVLDDGEW
jgi:hypothetical protein